MTEKPETFNEFKLPEKVIALEARIAAALALADTHEAEGLMIIPNELRAALKGES